MNLTRCLHLTNTVSQGIFGNFHLTTAYFYVKNFILSPCCILEKKSRYSPNLQCAVGTLGPPFPAHFRVNPSQSSIVRIVSNSQC